MHEDKIVGKRLKFKEDVSVFQFENQDGRCNSYIKILIFSNAIMVGKRDYEGPFTYGRLSDGAMKNTAATEEGIVIPEGCMIEFTNALRKGGVNVNVWDQEIDRDKVTTAIEVG